MEEEMPTLGRFMAPGLVVLAAALAIVGAAQATTTTTYTYDTLGRLQTAVYVDSTSGHTYTYTYGYDALGNRILINTTIG